MISDRKLEDLTINVAALLFETRIALSAVHIRVEMLGRRSTEPPVKAELATLEKLSNQACDALETLQRVLVQGLTTEGEGITQDGND